MSEPQKQFAGDFWEGRARAAHERRERLRSFGPNVRGLYVVSEEGSFVLDPEDGSISQELMEQGLYNDWEYKVLESIISKESDVLIVGAHIGTHTVRLSRHCRSIIAIEANPKTFQFLKANLLLNECANVTAHGVAASNRAEKIRFLLSRDNSAGSKRMPLTVHPTYVYDDPETIEIDAVPLDTLIGPRAFELVLLDIEGSEYFAMQGMQGILASARTLSVEFMPHLMKNVANAGVEDFLGLLSPHFQWMCVPRHNRVYPKHEILPALKAMYQAGENHEGLFFLKNPLPDWLLRRQKKEDGMGQGQG
jgi:FkbM family methyltransferase